MREEACLVARGADVEAVDTLAARGAKRTFRRCPEVELAVADDVAAERLGERLRHLFPDLVATPAAPRSDPRRANSAAGAHTDRDDSGEQPAPPHVQDPARRRAAVRPHKR